VAKKPVYRAFDDWWYVQLDANGKRTQKKLVKGKANEAEAFQAFYRLMADGPDLPPPRTLTAAKCCDLFLNHSQKHNATQTYGWYKGYLQSFCDLFGSVPALDLEPFHVTRWLDRNPGWQGSRRSAIAALKRAFNWCEDEGILPHNPLKRVKKPPQTCRERVLTPTERRTVLTGIKDQSFREYVFALLETGCRPGEARTVCGHLVNLQLGAWVFPPKEHKTGSKTGKPRVIYLSPAMLTLTKRLMKEHPDGPLFRSFRGNRPYTRQAVRCRFRRLRAKFPELANVVSYTLRHTFTTDALAQFTTDALAQSVPIATVADLLGHPNTIMVSRHYRHLGQKEAHLRDAANRLSRGEYA
jgi:integrase